MVVKRSAKKRTPKRSPKRSRARVDVDARKSGRKVIRRTRLLTAVKVRKGKNSAAKRVRVAVLKKQLSNRKEVRKPADINDMILEINGLAFAADDHLSGVFLTDKYTISQLESRLKRLRKKHGAIPHI